MNGLDEIAVFVKVIQSGSFTKASKLLSMPNTTVSARISSLEKRLGVTLIRRTTRKLSLTVAGEGYYRRCVLALKEIQAAESEVVACQSQPQGSLRITAPLDIGSRLLSPIVTDYLHRYPKVSIELSFTTKSLNFVEEGMDLALRVGELKDSALVCRKFTEVPGGLFSSPEYLKKYGTPKVPDDLGRCQFVLFKSVQRFSLFPHDDAEPVMIKPKGRLILDDMEAVRAYVCAGQGVGLLPYFPNENSASNEALIRILPEWTYSKLKVWFVYPQQQFLNVNTKAFIDLAVKNTPGAIGF